MPKGIIKTGASPHLQQMLERASRAQLLDAVREISAYYELCAREGVWPERWQSVLGDALDVLIADARQGSDRKSKFQDETLIQGPDYERRDYSAVYSDQ